MPVKMSGHRECVFQDSVNEFLEIAGDYDGFVFGTPVHWAGATGAMTSLWTESFMRISNGGSSHFRLKPAAAVISARRAGTTATWDQMNKYFGLMQMPIVTSQYWNMAHGPARKTCGRIWRDCRPCEPLGTIWHFSLTARTWD